VLDTLEREGLPGIVLKIGTVGGTGVYRQGGSTLRVVEADRPYGEFHDFYSDSPKYFGYTLILWIDISS
jgi:hypothetical protein